MTKERMLAALLFNGANVGEKALQERLLSSLTKALTEGQTVEADDFALLAEDALAGRPVSLRKARRLVEQSGAFTLQGDRWQLAEASPATLEELQAFFAPQKAATQSTDDPARGAILQGMRWCIQMVQMAQEAQMNGLPAFLSCSADGDGLIGINVAGTATSDALSMLCAGLDYLRDCEIPLETLTTCFAFLVEKTLASQCGFGAAEADPWDKGGFWPYEDQPEAAHPTVDATCLAIMALCDFYLNRQKLEQQLQLVLPVENTVIEQAVLDGLEFLFRVQLWDGSFGIYRYQDETAAEPLSFPNENCTRIAMSTMGVCKGSGIFDARECFQYYPKCSDVIAACYAALQQHRAQAEPAPVWAPYFGETASNYPVANVVTSTARVCRAFIPVWWQCKDQRENIRLYNKQLAAYWLAVEDKVTGKVGRYTFNTPTEKVYSVSPYSWESHPEMLAAFALLQAYNLFDLALTRAEWQLIERAVQRTLALQHPHGHWNKPVAERVTPFCAVSLAAIELLREYRIAKGLI